MNFYIQDSTLANSLSLHETLLKNCREASSGGGMFAFVSRSGIQLFLEDESFIELINRGEFELIVGMDSITNINALNALNHIDKNAEKFSVQAFLHQLNGKLFHPKFCWFKKDNGGVLIVGSGNLTVGGLRRNWEAFAEIELDNQQLRAIEQTWKIWHQKNAQHLKSIADDAVLAQAKANIIAIKKQKTITLDEEDTELNRDADEIDEENTTWQFANQNEVLIAQIPRASSRWGQANFDKRSFEEFFGATIGDNTLRIILRQVDNDGKLGELEVRQSVSVKSQNYRFELKAATGLDYPTTGRPTGVFIKISSRMFLYTLIMPDDANYAEIEKFIQKNATNRQDRMNRIRTKVATLKTDCPSLAFWKI